MEFDKIIKFNDEVLIENKRIMSIYGEFNKTTGHCSIYYNPINVNELKNNKEEIQKQINEFKNKLKQIMESEEFLYTI